MRTARQLTHQAQRWTPRPTQSWLLCGACLLLGGCSFLNDAVWPTLSGDAPADGPTPAITTDFQIEDTTPPPLFDADPFMASLDASEARLTAIGSRLPDHRARLDQAQDVLVARANRVEDADSAREKTSGETDFDRWASTQIQLSRLNNDIVTLDILREDIARDAADVAIAVAHLTALGETTDIPDDEARKLTEAGIHANEILVRIGVLQERLETNLDRWQNYAQAQADRIGVRQTGEIMEPGEFEVAQPRATRTTRTTTTNWPDSGDRFKGRKPLMSVNFSDPEIAYKDELRDLMGRVQTQYPDIAFDLEVVGVDASEVNAVIRLLDGLNVDAQPYRTLQLPDEPPILRLFPR
jgi:hypothetical protein